MIVHFKHSVVLFLLVLALIFPLQAEALKLWDGPHTTYAIALSREASTSEATAAQELQSALKLMSGVDFPIIQEYEKSSSSATHYIYIGYSSRNAAFRGLTPYGDLDEGFSITTVGSDLLIYGGRQRGTMYGVFALLEDQFGARWFAPDCTVMPRRSVGYVPQLAISQQPAFDYRFDYTYDGARQSTWCAHNRLNMQPTPVSNAYGNITSYWGTHTFQKLLPPDEYFENHPEYFSLRDGKRIADGQLCLSNPEVLHLVTERLRRYMKANPDFWGYDVSQNDNQLFCTCSRCRSIERRYGGHSGLMLWFVNQVANAVYEEFPDKLIGTFAYQYTRKPPRRIRPAANVVIRLCNIECCFIHPFDGCPQNAEFLDDMKRWNALTDRIFVWDYTVDFHHYHLPFADFGVLGRNLQLFRENGVTGVLELGGYDVPWTNFSELRQWIIAKLLWNPRLDVDSLAHEFIDAYYGPAASDVLAYYQAVCALPHGKVHFRCNSEPDTLLYPAAFRHESLRQLLHAESVAAADPADSLILRRVQRVLVQAYTMRALMDKPAAATDGTILRLQQILESDPTRMRERGQTIQQFLRSHGYI